MYYLDRKRRLDSVNFAWSVREMKKTKLDKRDDEQEGSTTESENKAKSYDMQWNEMLEKLKEYKEREGLTLVPKRYKDKMRFSSLRVLFNQQ